MARKKTKPDEQQGEGVDRHSSGFMVRLPEELRERLRKFQDQHFAEHRIRPAMTALIVQAVEDWLATRNL